MEDFVILRLASGSRFGQFSIRRLGAIFGGRELMYMVSELQMQFRLRERTSAAVLRTGILAVAHLSAPPWLTANPRHHALRSGEMKHECPLIYTVYTSPCLRICSFPHSNMLLTSSCDLQCNT
ncbi:unnamed protein product [Fraxinus pennsylvanica]|uniref:Uncharacterized protein n=1 Tax=Fraxinus pennsylvanica TaxID=56036 RepID=A0AAD1ZHN6_9LAMI|nr:unnamed protein product [Fraxinus pennsylvanica]